MCLALTSEKIKTKILPNNYNFPTQTREEVNFDVNKPIYLLHYHNAISSYGYFKSSHVNNDEIASVVEQANSQIYKFENLNFYSKFRNSLIRYKEDGEDCQPLTNSLANIYGDSKKITLLLHIGSPKTGTSSLQYYLDKNRNNLLSQGVLYPLTLLEEEIPKHQWIIKSLKSNNHESLVDSFEKIHSEMNDSVHTIILSTEGVFNQWGELKYKGISYLKSLNKVFNLKFLLWLREPVSFTSSYYVQCLKNPRLKSRECFGRDISIMDLLDDSWFQGVLDYLSILNELKYHFSIDQMKVFKYNGKTIDQFCEYLNIPKYDFDSLRENTSLSSLAINQLRMINNYNLSNEEKSKVVKYLYQIDGIMKNHVAKAPKSEKVNKKINELFKRVIPEIESHFNIDLRNN